MEHEHYFGIFRPDNKDNHWDSWCDYNMAFHILQNMQFQLAHWVSSWFLLYNNSNNNYSNLLTPPSIEIDSHSLFLKRSQTKIATIPKQEV